MASLAIIPIVALAAGCEKTPSGVTKAKLIVVSVARKLFKITNVGVDLVELAVEIKAIIDGKEETIQARITREEADTLKNGGQLVIKGEDGREFPVEHSTK